ncbi:MAG: hypothetical protein ACPKM0_09715 [Pleomorphochaeta sp.]
MLKKTILGIFIFSILVSCSNVSTNDSTNKTSSEATSSASIEAEDNQNVSSNEDPLAIAAKELGIDAVELQNALGNPSDGAPNFEEVADTLGIDATELENVMKKIMASEEQSVTLEPYDTVINGVTFNITYELFTWDTLPEDVEIESMGIEEFTNEDGVTHYYEFFYLPAGNLNWYQVATLAEEAGGYLACPTSDEENAFIFSHFNDDKFFWYFDEEGEHYGIGIGPFLGGYQPVGSAEPDGGWSWLSGETWDYSNWAQNLDDGIIDKDPRDNTQPNDSGDGQPIMGYGELNQPVPTWGDYMETIGTYGSNRLPGRSYGFTIEYEENPNK